MALYDIHLAMVHAAKLVPIAFSLDRSEPRCDLAPHERKLASCVEMIFSASLKIQYVLETHKERRDRGLYDVRRVGFGYESRSDGHARDGPQTQGRQ